MSLPRVMFMHYLDKAKGRSSFKTNHEHSRRRWDNVQRKVSTWLNEWTTQFCCRLSTITRCVYSLIWDKYRRNHTFFKIISYKRVTRRKLVPMVSRCSTCNTSHCNKSCHCLMTNSDWSLNFNRACIYFTLPLQSIISRKFCNQSHCKMLLSKNIRYSEDLGNQNALSIPWIR